MNPLPGRVVWPVHFRRIKEVRSKPGHFHLRSLFAVLMSAHQLSRACCQEALKRTASYLMGYNVNSDAN